MSKDVNTLSKKIYYQDDNFSFLGRSDRVAQSKKKKNPILTARNTTFDHTGHIDLLTDTSNWQYCADEWGWSPTALFC